jgi:hypothetical protein
MIQELLTEKLRPKELKHMILPARIKNSFEGGKFEIFYQVKSNLKSK